MKNITYILKRDIRRILTNWVAILVVLGVCILPSFYAWFNIGANYDPYNSTSQIKIAISNEDLGTTISNKKINAGGQIEKKLKNNHKLGWTFVSSEDAKAGVKSGEYYAALCIPESFSQSLTSFLDGNIQEPVIHYYVNEKKNAVAPKITDTGASTVQQTVDAVFKNAVATVAAEILKNVAGTLQDGINSGSDDIIDTIGSTRNVLGEYRTTIQKFHNSYGSYTRTIRNTIALTQSLDKNLNALQKAVNSGDKIVSTAEKDTALLAAAVKQFKEDHPEVLVEITDDLLADLNEMDVKLMTTDRILNSTSGLITTIKPAGGLAADMLENLQSSLYHSDKALTSMSGALTSTDELLEDAQTALKSLKSSEIFDSLASLTNTDTDEFGKFMASPIELKKETLYPVKTYGSGMTPFYTMLAIWVSGFILIAIFHLEVDTEGEKRRITMSQTYFARGILFTIIGIIQAVIISIGDIWLIGIQCLHPGLFILGSVIASIVFVNLIYALAITFRHVGKALAVILVILQIPGSSGTYPIELTGDFFQTINPFLPFTYGIAALRETIGGMYGIRYVNSLLVLLIFLVIALFIGLVLRPLLMNINNTFDTKLEETGLFETDHGPEENKIKKVRQILYILSSTSEGMAELDRNANAFERKYNWMLNRGIIIALIPPIVLLLLLFILPAKPILLVMWVISVILVCVFLFLVEHIHTIAYEKKYATNPENLPQELKEVARDE